MGTAAALSCPSGYLLPCMLLFVCLLSRLLCLFSSFVFFATQYLGGLLDLTGELNRFAVARATERDSVGVKQCLETVLVVRPDALSLMLISWRLLLLRVPFFNVQQYRGLVAVPLSISSTFSQAFSVRACKALLASSCCFGATHTDGKKKLLASSSDRPSLSSQPTRTFAMLHTALCTRCLVLRSAALDCVFHERRSTSL